MNFAEDLTRYREVECLILQRGLLEGPAALRGQVRNAEAPMVTPTSTYTNDGFSSVTRAPSKENTIMSWLRSVSKCILVAGVALFILTGTAFAQLVPFPRATSASIAAPRLQDSRHVRRVEESHLRKDASNVPDCLPTNNPPEASMLTSRIDNLMGSSNEVSQ